MQEWRKQMNERLGLAAEMARQGNLEAATNYATAAQAIAERRGTSAAQQATQAAVAEYSGGGGNYLGPGGESQIIPGSDSDGGPGIPIVPQGHSGDPSGGGNGGGGGGSSTSYPSAPNSTPATPYWITERTVQPKTGIKQADPDIVLDPDIDTTGDYIVERFFEELGGTELIKLSRYDLIDGISVSYNPIANLSQLRKRFNPNNIISLDFLSENEFTRASIDLLSRGIYEPYFNDNGDLVIEIDIIRTEENIEAEISQTGTVSRIEL